MGSQGNSALTLDDFLALREAAPDGIRYEAVGGRAVVVPSPTGLHQDALGELLGLLRAAARPAGLRVIPAPWDWVLWQVPTLTLRQPDLLVVTPEQRKEARLTSPPLAAIEILSPGTRDVDLRDKRREYAQAGAEHYWLVDLDRPSIDVLTLSNGRYRTAVRAEGEAALTVAEPFRISLSPAALLL
jgi:Uma2 family endonuclease